MNVRRDFYPRSPCGERPAATVRSTHSRQFLSTLSLRRATRWQKPLTASPTISIHALLAESDDAAQVGTITEAVFLSTLSLRRATRATTSTERADINFYPRSPCGERHHTNHAIFCQCHFYPRSPCGERLEDGPSLQSFNSFLSTLSLRRATLILSILVSLVMHFYPRSPCGERPRYLKSVPSTPSISIHALLAESDLNSLISAMMSILFLSTLSLRRATSC